MNKWEKFRLDELVTEDSTNEIPDWKETVIEIQKCYNENLASFCDNFPETFDHLLAFTDPVISPAQIAAMETNLSYNTSEDDLFELEFVINTETLEIIPFTKYSGYRDTK